MTVTMYLNVLWCSCIWKWRHIFISYVWKQTFRSCNSRKQWMLL